MSLESLLNNYSFTCIIIAMLATLCFFYNDSSYYKIAKLLSIKPNIFCYSITYQLSL